MKRHVTCFVEKVGFEPKTLGTKAERYDHCATRPVMIVLYATKISMNVSNVKDACFYAAKNVLIMIPLLMMKPTAQCVGFGTRIFQYS